MCLDIFAEVGAVSSEQAGIKYVVGLVKFKLQLPGREGEGGGGPKTRTLYKYWPGQGHTPLATPPPPSQEAVAVAGGGMGIFGISVKLLQIRLIGLQQLFVKFVLWVAVVTAAHRGPRSHLNQIEYVFSLMLQPSRQ